MGALYVFASSLRPSRYYVLHVFELLFLLGVFCIVQSWVGREPLETEAQDISEDSVEERDPVLFNATRHLR